MPKTAAPITFIVSQSQAVAADTARGAAAARLPAGLARGRRKQLVHIGAQRGAGAETRVEAVPGEDVVVLHIAGGPALVLHPKTARDLMLAQSDAKQTRGASAENVTADGVAVPANLHWVGLDRPATRGWLGNVIVSAVEVLTGLVKDPAADLAASGIVKRVDAQVDAGVYQLDAATLPPLKGSTPLAKVPAADTPALVLLHGTFSNTSGTFEKLWTQHPQRVRELFDRYKGRVYGLDHPTLGVSPIENALALAETLPRDATLHLLSHSRGGLVAEVLARACADPDLRPGDLKPFAGADYKRQRDALQQLAATVKQRRIQVERLVRVACPARGTLLASKRLDAYLSVFKWTLELAGAPVLPELVDFLGEVAQRRTDPTLIPGLAAQMPNSPLVQWLHAVEAPIPGSLRVIAGDIEGDSVTSWLKTLLADAFYWTDHDLVVQTRSMYGGAPRKDGATFVFDQGGAVSHFNYFTNVRTADAIADALVQDSPAGFRTIGPLSWAGESSTGTRGVDRGAVRAADDGTPPEQKPAVFILPGILGSNLKVGKDRIWLGWRLVNGLQRLAYRQGAPDGVEPDGPIGMYYDDLGRFLAHSHQAIEFAFDWRKPMEEEARRLADEVDKALTARTASGKPVRLLAHSMGGVLARTMQLERPGTWDKMMQRDGARLLMLGTPNAGSWAPMQVLSGDDTFGNLMVTVGAPFQDKAARELMARLPGFLQLQASLRGETPDLGSTATWASLAAEDLKRLEERSWWHNLEVQLGVYAWGVPPQDVLDRAVALRKRLDDQLGKPPTGFRDKLAMVIGRAEFTPDGYEIGDEGLVYRNAPDHGDGRVTLASALLAGVPTWAVNCVHGSLPDFKDGFAGYLDLLESGQTDKLTLWSEGRGVRAAATAVSYVRSRPAHDSASVLPPEDQNAVVARQARPRPPGAPRDTALRITVRNGDLSFVHEPLLLGHYQSLRLTGTEYVMDRLIGGQMKDALAVGHYPEATGEHAIFLNTRAPADDPRQLPRPQAVVVVGLGEEGKLRAGDLARAVRQATIGWLLRAAERGDAPVEVDLAATLIGSGGSGITVGQSAQLIAQGVREANERLHDANQRWRTGPQRPGGEPGRGTSWPLVGHLFLTELYLDRANEAWRALRVQARATPRDYALSDTVPQGIGAIERPLDSGYRGADYDFISAIAEPDAQGDARIAYTLDTKRARSEVRAQKTQGRLLRELVASGSTDQNSDPQIGSTLFKLLIPVEMEPFFGGSTEMQLELNDGTAGIPWELLDTDSTGGDPRPWAIRAKLLRKLRTVEFRAKVQDASPDGGILVIGEPEASPEAGRNVTYPRLPGAREEAKAVAALFSQQRQGGGPGALGEVRSLISPDDPARVGPDARTVMNALMERDRVWRIVHIAGHGEPPDQVGADPTDPNDRGQGPGNPRGVVLSGGTYLGPREIAALRVVPELVFVNCCYLGARPAASVLDVETPGYLDDRAKFAAGVAEKLIETGVRCVIAAGWAVGDAPAKEFAQVFYGALLANPPTRFIDAVAQAREAARALGGNTWAAYQCYGDPDWILRRGGSDPQAPPRPLQDEFGAVASSDGLELALRTLETRSLYQHAPVDEQRGKIRYLESRFASLWGGRGSVAEAFGAAWNAAQDPDAAVAWYRRALAANDGTASLKAAEQLGNLQVRQAWAAAKRTPPAPTPPTASTKGKGKRVARGRATRGAGPQARVQALKAASAAIDEGFAQLQRVAAIEPSVERLSLCGSAWKRQAMVAKLAGDQRAERAALAQMRDWYARAEELARRTKDPGLFYPALNRIAAEVAGAAGRTVALDDADLDPVRQNLADRNRDNPDFWSVAALTDLRMYEALARGELAKALPAIEREYDDLYRRCDADWLWKSVSDQADFVLSICAAAATGSERNAAQSLRQSLAKKAGV